MKAKVDAAKADIIAGKIKVVDYMADNACKSLSGDAATQRASAAAASAAPRSSMRGIDKRFGAVHANRRRRPDRARPARCTASSARTAPARAR